MEGWKYVGTRRRLCLQPASHLLGMTGLRQLLGATVRVPAPAGSEELERKCDVFGTELGWVVQLQKAPSHPAASWASTVWVHTLPHDFLVLKHQLGGHLAKESAATNVGCCGLGRM